jgi:UDP-glucose:(heptosyl)LPS alpha-1,3-glucosyltransferase
MKVGLVLEHFDPQRGGLEHWTYQFARELVGAGHEVHVITCGFVDPGPELPLIWHAVEESPSPLQRAKAMENVLRGLTLDIIHDMGCGWHADIFHAHGGSSLAWAEHNLMRIPRWRQFRLWREKRYREQEKIEKRQHSQPHAVFIAVSRMVQNHLETLHHIPRDRIRLIYNGVDTDRFSPASCQPLRNPTRASFGIADHETVFVMVAHNLRLKNAESAILAIARLTSKGERVRLLIVGGKRPKPFLSMTRKLSLSQNVIFVETVEDVLPYFAAAEACLHPTWYDPCSLVSLEALACGLPLITTRYNGVCELMTDGKEGFTIENPSDIGSLAGRMEQLLQSSLRVQQGVAARALARKHSLNDQKEKFLKLYRELGRDPSSRA